MLFRSAPVWKKHSIGSVIELTVAFSLTVWASMIVIGFAWLIAALVWKELTAESCMAASVHGRVGKDKPEDSIRRDKAAYRA